MTATRLLAGLLAAAATLAVPAHAEDIHVTLADSSGIMRDCPNPAHNSMAVSSTDALRICKGGSQDRRLVGSHGAIGRISDTSCAEGGGTVEPLTRADAAAGVHFDADGQLERVYSHPQAAVYNMALSDSVEIHAGVYSKAGGECDANCSELNTMGVCDAWDTCWQATVLAFGMGPRLNNEGYGTPSAPAYIRGAWMDDGDGIPELGEVDTWDADGDKIPDTEPGEPPSYPAILSGDIDGDGQFDTTVCDGEACTGDAHYAIIVGCTAGWNKICDVTHDNGQKSPEIDSDGDGLLDRQMAQKTQQVDYLIIKDLELKGYNGGSQLSGSRAPRDLQGLISLGGEGAYNSNGSDGLVIDHLYIHDNDFSLHAGEEINTSVFHDKTNFYCDTFTEFKNNFIVQNNEHIWQTDTCDNCDSGCPQSIHDNRILVDVTSSRAATRPIHIGYWKSIDTFNGATSSNAKSFRFWNNEVIVKRVSGAGAAFGDIGLLGNAYRQGLGEFWVYGNLFRRHPEMAANWVSFWYGFGHPPELANTSWRLRFFNNTMDLGIDMNVILSMPDTTGEILSEKNNAYFSGTGAHKNGSYGNSSVALIHRANEFCAGSISYTDECTVPSRTGFSDWFAGPPSTSTFDGLSSYAPASDSPLVGAGSCDPDGDGEAGVDYDADGVNDTTWLDLAGNVVDCPTPGSPTTVGAIQAPAGASNTPPAQPDIASVSGVTANGATLTGSAFADPDAGDSHAGSQFQIDLAGGAFTSPVADSGPLGAVTSWSATGLVPATGYVSRIRYMDSRGAWSSWSPADGGAFLTGSDDVAPEDVTNLRRSDTEPSP